MVWGSKLSSRFEKQDRLSRPVDYQNVFRAARKFSDSNFLILANYHADRKARLGLAVSKKKLHRAVDRNRVKRIIRESFRQSKHSLRGWDIVVMVQRAQIPLNNNNMYNSLNTHWQRLEKCKN